ARERGQDRGDLGQRRRDVGRRGFARTRDAFGERRERQPRVLETAEVVGGEVLERRRERAEESGEGSRLRRPAHASRWWSCSGRTANGPRARSSIPSAAAAAAASVVKYGTRHSSAVRRI